MDPDRLFADEVGKYELLSKEEERSLVWLVFNNKDLPPPPNNHRIQDKYRKQRQIWKEARDTLVSCNLRLVKGMARKYMGRGIEYEDLVGWGCVGLVHAIDLFDPSKFESRICTYVVYWIKQAIRRALSTGTLIQIPVHHWRAMAIWSNAAAELSCDLGRDPTEAEVLEVVQDNPELKNSLNYLKFSFNARGTCSYSNTEDKENPVLMTKLLSDEEDVDAAIDRFAQVEEYHTIVDVLRFLPKRTKRMICLRYGLEGERQHTLAEAGAVLGITRERVRQLQTKAEAYIKRELCRLQRKVKL